MQDLDYVLNFTVNMVREMLVSGANLERTNLMVQKLLMTYGMHDISIFSLSTHVRVAAFAEDDSYWSRQVDVPASGVHLERLRQLNDLSYRVCKEKPAPAELDGMFRKACVTKEYPWWMLLIGQVLALFVLCFIMGGVWQDALAVVPVTIGLFFVEAGLSRTGLAYILKDMIGMWAATMMALLVYRLGLGMNIDKILITLCFELIPGIPLVNGVRNLLCGNEMNGILQLARVVLESMALMCGIYLGILMVGGNIPW